MQVDGPRELGMRVAVSSRARMPLTDPAPLDIDLIGLCWGPLADMDELLAPVERFQATDSQIVAAMAFPAAPTFVASTTPKGTYGIKTGFVTGPLSAEGIVTMLEWIGTMPGFPSRVQESPARPCCWGGKVNDLASDTTAFVHRDPDFLFKREAL